MLILSIRELLTQPRKKKNIFQTDTNFKTLFFLNHKKMFTYLFLAVYKISFQKFKKGDFF